MAGKPYTVSEMKAILDYLIEHKAYSETKGRKMWQEFQNSQKTNRTWQSLKETFIKRILPDIHNPYYNLTLDQIRSFQQGCDVAEKEKKNRLEIQIGDTICNDTKQSNKKDPSTNNDEVPTTSKEKDPSTIINLCEEELENLTGEAAKIESRNRSSADTIVLENCYENAEELQRALESPKIEKDMLKKTPLKDLLTFEPMTPLIKDLLDDFETESETSDRDSELKIDENNSKTGADEESPIDTVNTEQDIQNDDEIQNSEDIVEANHKAKDSNKTTDEETSLKISTAENNNLPNKSLKLKKPQNTTESNINSKENENDDENRQKNKDSIVDALNTTDAVTANTNIADKSSEPVSINKNNNQKKRNSEGAIQISGNSTSDTILPNNQEGLNNTKKADQNEMPEKQNRKRGGQMSAQVSQDKGNKKQKLTDNNKPNGKDELENIEPAIEIYSHSPIIDRIPEIIICSETPDVNPGSVVDLNTDSSKNYTEAQFEALNSVSYNNDKPSTGTKEVSDNNISNNLPDKNPCLQSVSLFEEQFKTTQYSDSNSDDGKAAAPKQNPEKPQKEKSPECVKKRSPKIVKDYSDKDSTLDSTVDSDAGKPTRNKEDKQSKIQRERAIAHVFGFGNGGATTSRKRRHSYKRNYHYRREMSKHDSNSSEWTSDSGTDEYVCPPRARKCRMKKKILKPHASRILQDTEEGMLYVIFGKKIYPLVKDGKHIKNFVTCRVESGSEFSEESYWKMKYLAEKKKSEDLMKYTGSIPIPQYFANGKQEDNIPKEVEKKQESKDGTLVLKFATEGGEELRLEGGWSQISSALPQMLQILRKPAQSKGTMQLKIQPDGSSNIDSVIISSGRSTPVPTATNIDPEVHEKVNKIETEIFKEIEEREKEEQSTDNQPTAPINVTKRRGRPRKTSSSSVPSPAKRKKTPKTDVATKQDLEVKAITKGTENKRTSNLEELAEANEEAQTSVKLVQKSSPIATTSKDSKKIETEVKEAIQEQKNMPEDQQRRKSARISKQRSISAVREDKSPMEAPPPVRQIRTPRKYETDSSASDARTRSRRSVTKDRTKPNDINFDDENVRFMLPPTPSKTNKKSPIVQKKKSPKDIERDNLNSVDSTQGYQDSDPSPFKGILKRKRKISLCTHRKNQTRRSTRRKSYPSLLTDLMTSDSNNSSYFIPLRKSQSTLNSAVYKTDSYQLLVPKQRQPTNKLECIEENAATRKYNTRNFKSVSKNNSDKSSNDLNVEIGSSSGVSLPLSPELSIVENLSISRELIKDTNTQILTEIQTNRSSKMDFSEYMISEVDVSRPLMNQHCEPKTSRPKTKTPRRASKSTLLSDTFMHKVCTVNLEDISLTLDQRLRNLLLESGKKKESEKENVMEVDPPKKITEKKGKAKKRCSTPRSKKNAQKVKAPRGSVIEEEHVENCLGGRNSCPPVITLVSVDENANNNADVVLNKNVAPRKKKDIIKVKIQRPKSKSPIERQPKETFSVGNTSKVTTCTDSGINDAELSDIFKGTDYSVDLIHNHSETCLLAVECMENSVEFVESKSTSVISVNSTPQSPDSNLQMLLQETHHLPCDLFDNLLEEANNAQTSSQGIFMSPETVYFSPAATNSSLITEDLSDEIPLPKQKNEKPEKWYLLSDDDNTNTQTANTSIIGFGSNLKDLFPLACAVPNLSTVSERSKENDSPKYYDSQSLNFDRIDSDL